MIETEEYDEDSYLVVEQAECAVENNLEQMFRFFYKVEKQRVADPDGCWNWTGAITSTTGYGRVVIGGSSVDTHRAAWTFMRGTIPLDREVCHHCDNRACVNPSHLFLGTRSDNMRDARNKGRVAGQKLQLGQVDAIREALATGATQADLATQYGVSRSTISGIARRRTWQDITAH